MYAVREKLVDATLSARPADRARRAGARRPGMGDRPGAGTLATGAWVYSTRSFMPGEGKRLKAVQGIVPHVNALEPEVEQLCPTSSLWRRPAEFKAAGRPGAVRHTQPGPRAASSSLDALDDLLPEAFTTMREAGKRVLGQRHFDVQVMGGAALRLGWVAEMKTGEGKTLVARCPAYLNASSGKACTS